MAGIFRVFARLGYAEGMSGHISVLDPIRTDAMWMNPLGVNLPNKRQLQDPVSQI